MPGVSFVPNRRDLLRLLEDRFVHSPIKGDSRKSECVKPLPVIVRDLMGHHDTAFRPVIGKVYDFTQREQRRPSHENGNRKKRTREIERVGLIIRSSLQEAGICRLIVKPLVVAG